jgi:hypothetical protein
MFDPVKCGKCIAQVGMDIQGHDPRGWIKSAMWQCVSDNKITGGHFKAILERKIKKSIKDISNPEKYVNDIWNKVSKKCKG